MVALCVPSALQMGVGLSIAEELGRRQAAEKAPPEEPEEAAAPEQPEQPKSAKNGEPQPGPQPYPAAEYISPVSTASAERMHASETTGSVQRIYADQDASMLEMC